MSAYKYAEINEMDLTRLTLSEITGQKIQFVAAGYNGEANYDDGRASDDDSEGVVAGRLGRMAQQQTHSS